MKNKILTIAFVLISVIAFSQDNLFVMNNWGAIGITQLANVDPNTAVVNGTVTTYAEGDNTTSSAAMGMSVSGKYIYYIAQTGNSGNFDVRSIPVYPAPGISSAPAAGVLQLTADINGDVNTNQVFFRRLGVAPNGWAYMVATEEGTGQVYLARFFTNGETGEASNFQNLGTITLDGVAFSPNFNNGDLVFDGNGNMYILVNQDAAGGDAVIYYVGAASISAASGPLSVTNITTKYVIKNESGTNFQGLVTGLALSSTGTFYVAVQGGSDGGVYYINSGVQDGVVTIKGPGNIANRERLADLTSNYYPTNTVLPVVYGDLKANISNNELLVRWTTVKETNNAGFEIEVSKDGKEFVSIGKVDTKALNGNSDQVIQYSFIKSTQGLALLGASIVCLAFALLLVNRKNQMLFSLIMIVGLGITATSCSKSGKEIDVTGESKLFVRLVQVDKDGKKSTSDVITALKAD